MPSVWVEVGPTEMHYTPDKIDTSAGMYHVTTAPADHGLAATGGRIVANASKLLAEKGSGRALVSICAAGGQGVVAILER